MFHFSTKPKSQLHSDSILSKLEKHGLHLFEQKVQHCVKNVRSIVFCSLVVLAVLSWEKQLSQKCRTCFPHLISKAFMRKIRTSRRHLSAGKRAIHGTWDIWYIFVCYFVKTHKKAAFTKVSHVFSSSYFQSLWLGKLGHL